MSLSDVAIEYLQWKFFEATEPAWHRAWRESEKKGGEDG